MKKLILFALSLFVFASLQAQTLSLVNPTPDALDVPANADYFVFSARVVNTDTATHGVLAERIENSLAAGHVSQFCWVDECYPPTRNLSDLLNLDGGDTLRTFFVEVYPNNAAGTSSMKFSLYLSDNPADSISQSWSITFVEATSRRSGVEKGATLAVSNNQPGSTQWLLEYALPQSANDAATVQITDLQGRLVFMHTLDGITGKLAIEQTHLPAGQYLLNVFGGEQVIGTHKLVK